MVDQPPPGAPEAPAPRCPWCAAPLPVAAIDVCPACGAQLQAVGAHPIPGVTEIDALAYARRPLQVSTPSLGSLFMGGVDVDRPTPDELPAFAPPAEAVRREMLRLELEAVRAELAQEMGALEAEERLRLAEEEEAAGRPGGGEVTPAGDAAGDGEGAPAGDGEVTPAATGSGDGQGAPAGGPPTAADGPAAGSEDAESTPPWARGSGSAGPPAP